LVCDTEYSAHAKVTPWFSDSIRGKWAFDIHEPLSVNYNKLIGRTRLWKANRVPAIQRCNLITKLIYLLQDRAAMPDKYRAGFCRVQATVIAQEELRSETQLEVGQSVARIGLRHICISSGHRKASTFSAKNDEPK
jgi:hypothetical protein